MSVAARWFAGVMSCVLVLSSCASKQTRDDKAALAGKKVEDASAVKVWHEGEQEAGAKSEPAAAAKGDGASDAIKEATGDIAAPTAVATAAAGMKEVFPSVRVDVAKHEVEFDAEVPAYAYVGKEGVVYLEVLVCTRDTREHEAVLVTGARASDGHAALLMSGLVPGAAGGWEWKEKQLLPILPKGEGVEVMLVLERAGAKGIDGCRLRRDRRRVDFCEQRQEVELVGRGCAVLHLSVRPSIQSVSRQRSKLTMLYFETRS